MARRCALALAGALALWAGAGHADDLPAALGRISQNETVLAGTAICTGALVAPDLVLTAAHCVRGATADPDRIRFEADWRTGQPAEQHRGAEVFVIRQQKGAGLAAFADDVALIRLNSPSVLPPLALMAGGRTLEQGAVLQMFAFRRDASDRVFGPLACRLAVELPGFLGLGCPVVSGNSGAPVLVRVGQGWQISAVVVAAGKGQVQAWALPVPDWVRQRLSP